jgi:hypothetical protein
MPLSSDWGHDWPLLREAQGRLEATIDEAAVAKTIADGPILTLGDNESVEPRLIQAFRDLVCGGEVPVLAVRSDRGRLTPERVDPLLAAASSSVPLVPVDEIDADFDSHRDRSIFGPQSCFARALRPANPLL